MQKIGEALNLSAGDLVGHLNCRYLTELDLKVANGELEKPKVWDPVLEALAERGAQDDVVSAGDDLTFGPADDARATREPRARKAGWRT